MASQCSKRSITSVKSFSDTKLKLCVTTAAMRCIDKTGGLDSYVYHTPDHKLNSRLGVALKQRMHAIVKKYPEVDPPARVKRYPWPARYLEAEFSEQHTETTEFMQCHQVNMMFICCLYIIYCIEKCTV